MIKLSAFDTDKLKRYVRIEPGFAFKSKNFTNDDSDIPLVKGDNLHQGYIDWENSKRWPKEMLMGLDKFWLKSFDIVVAMDRPWVTSGLKWSYIKSKDPKSLLVQRVARIRTKDSSKIFQVFLRYLIGSNYFSNYVKPIVTGVNVPHISGTQIGNFIIPIPPITFQKKIAAILSAYDDLIENNTRRIAILEKTAEEIYKEWFVRMRFPGYERVKFEKGIPEGWVRKPLKNVTKLMKRGISPKYDEDSKKLVINQKCIRDGNIDLGIARTHNTNVANDKYIEFGDALINSTGVGTLGRVSVVCFTENNLTVDSHVTICRADRIEILPLYLSYTIKFLQPYFEYMATGATGQVELNKGFIETIKILLPSRGLQIKFQDCIEKTLEQKNFYIKKNINLKQTRNRLLTRLISGKLSVKDLDIRFPNSMKEDENAQFHQRGQH